eukprot:768743-Hanusia_phi.AAC.8
MSIAQVSCRPDAQPCNVCPRVILASGGCSRSGLWGEEDEGGLLRWKAEGPNLSQEAVQVEFDEKTLSYGELVEHFFRSHDASFPSGKRQYMSAIFFHAEEQEKIAHEVLNKIVAKKQLTTVIEPATEFYDAELYHQKWLLQRRRDWFATLELMSPEDLVDGQAASGLNAYVAGHLSQKDFRDIVDVWVRDKVISNDVWSAIRTK